LEHGAESRGQRAWGRGQRAWGREKSGKGIKRKRMYHSLFILLYTMHQFNVLLKLDICLQRLSRSESSSSSSLSVIIFLLFKIIEIFAFSNVERLAIFRN
jgi:hypothetical protein